MLPLGVDLPDDVANQWRFQLDDFVKVYQQPLAALAWGLQAEWQNEQTFLGIDLLPRPHFIRWDYADLESLNQQLNNKIQEVVGIIAGYDRTKEVAILVIASGQIKLLFFQPELSPPDCFKQNDGDVGRLITELEAALSGIRVPTD